MKYAMSNPESSGPRLNLPVLIALAGIFLGWFVLDTLVIRMGPVRHTLKFYEMLAAIIDPPRVLMGLDSGHLPSSIIFGLVCGTVLLGCLARSLPPRHRRPMLESTPLLLMLLCALLLFVRILESADEREWRRLTGALRADGDLRRRLIDIQREL